MPICQNNAGKRLLVVNAHLTRHEPDNRDFLAMLIAGLRPEIFNPFVEVLNELLALHVCINMIIPRITRPRLHRSDRLDAGLDQRFRPFVRLYDALRMRRNVRRPHRMLEPPESELRPLLPSSRAFRRTAWPACTGGRSRVTS